MLKGNFITQDDAQNRFFSSFAGKYNIMDNLDEKGIPLIQTRDKIYNSEYVYITVVLRGTLYLRVGSTELEVKANEYLAVTPCMSVEVRESKCIFFTMLTRSYIMAEIYERTTVIKKMIFHAFKFHHMHFTPEQINILLECYKRIKKEHLRKDYPMKEYALRAYQAAYVIKLSSFARPENDVNYMRNTRQQKFFNDFICMLNKEHRKERSVQYYANLMQITPKYLSAIVQSITGLTASQVIDQYVVYAIKQVLYTNEHNIKSISKNFNFPSQSFFGRYFKRITGMSPNEYIKQHNIKSINFEHSLHKEEK